MSLSSRIRRLPGYEELIGVMPSVSKGIAFVEDVAAESIQGSAAQLTLLDLGCGSGESADFFAALSPHIAWHGADIADSPEVGRRTRVDGRFKTFDGVNLPYEEGSFDIVYSRQVFEHVRHPHELMADVARVLRPGGHLVGSVAYLEPYHSLSTFNFTPFGMVYVMKHAGLQPIELRHSSDVFFAVFRQLVNAARFIERLRTLSPLYWLIELVGRVARLESAQISLLKLQFSSSFCFVAQKREV